MTSSDRTGSKTTGSKTTGSKTTGSKTTGSDTTSTEEPKTSPKPGARKRRRGTGAPKPLTVFTGSHGLQADKPRAGEDPKPDDTTDADSRTDLRR